MSYRANGLEHRWGTRVRVNIPVLVEATALPMGIGCMKNVSLSGAFMKSDRDLRLHTLIEVSITLPPPASRTAVIKAHVSRKLREGVGIEWYEFAPNIIKDLVRSALSSPLSR
jgi:PilZ domain